MRMAKERIREAQQPSRVKAVEFKPGDKVWLSARNIQIKQASRKLGPRQLGPFTVVERVGDLDYKLSLPPQLKLHPVFHADRLSPWGGNDVNGRLPPPPPPIEVKGEEEYKVEKIIDHRVQ